MSHKVLILCTGNSARSQMAEAFLREAGKDVLEVFSAGSNPAPRVNPFAVDVMKDAGFDLGDARPQHVDEYLNAGIQTVITVCDHAAEVCPVFPGEVNRVHLSFPDPALAKGPDQEVRAIFYQVRDSVELAMKGFAGGFKAGAA